MSDKTWPANCALAGAEALLLLQHGKEQEAHDKLTALTSNFQPEDVDYLTFRLKQLLATPQD